MSNAPTPFLDRAPEDVVQPCPEPPPPKTHWLEIELLGQDGKPIPWEEYRVVLPNRDVVTGYLDERGCARVEYIATAGQCAVTFPNRDINAWEPGTTSQALSS